MGALYEECRQRIVVELAHELARRLLRVGAAALSAAPLRVFLSHAKSGGRDATRELVAYFALEQKFWSWLDEVDLAPGGQWAPDIRKAAAQDVLLAVWTDAYSTRPWCRQEITAARKAEVPVVVLDMLEQSDAQQFPLLANATVLRWKG